MKRILVIWVIFTFVGLLSTGLGCNANPKPEVPVAAYGKIVDQLPDIPEAKQRYKYPENIDLRHIPR